MLDLAKARLTIHSSMVKAAMMIKSHYRQKHTTKFFEIGGYVYESLNQGLPYG
ncbi:hypothetical protein GGI42DRAFT_310063 [Trichoderma sp. SZMC 28013]